MGISGSTHPSEDSVVILVYAKGVLSSGQNEKINVTVTDKIPQELM